MFTVDITWPHLSTVQVCSIETIWLAIRMPGSARLKWAVKRDIAKPVGMYVASACYLWNASSPKRRSKSVLTIAFNRACRKGWVFQSLVETVSTYQNLCDLLKVVECGQSEKRTACNAAIHCIASVNCQLRYSLARKQVRRKLCHKYMYMSVQLQREALTWKVYTSMMRLSLLMHYIYFSWNLSRSVLTSLQVKLYSDILMLQTFKWFLFLLFTPLPTGNHF